MAFGGEFYERLRTEIKTEHLIDIGQLDGLFFESVGKFFFSNFSAQSTMTWYLSGGNGGPTQRRKETGHSTLKGFDIKGI